MGIKTEYTTRHGILLPDAYVRLTRLITNRNLVSMRFYVYMDEQSYIDNKPHIELIQKELGEGRPEIPATEEVLDEEGNVLTQAVEAIPQVLGMDDYFSIELLDGNTNPIRQAYIYLMSLPEFETGVEV